MVLYTIIKRLRKGGTEQSGLPLTFLLDEVAQLGNLDQIANVIETGRGYGLRVWMILQDYDQAKAGSSKPNLVLKTPKVRLFMNPTLETAQDMSAELGKINQVITGKDKPLAEPSELMGQDYKNTIVALSSGSRPLSLRKHFAWQDPDYEAITSQPYHLSAQTQPSNPLSPSDIQDLEITNKMRL
ncbi:MAG: type IV secretory system conjugative DNA transfer family protein [Pseudomonadota bacterium]